MSYVEELMATRGKTDQKIIEVTQSIVNQGIAAVFSDNPNINVIAIHAYRPHFNDGDECKWGIEVQVDWLGESFYSPEELVTPLLSKQRPQDWNAIKTQPDYALLEKARDLLYTYSREFEILDNGVNGTWWVFTRKASAIGQGVAFNVQTGNFDHD